jgi:hypothetical protein
VLSPGSWAEDHLLREAVRIEDAARDDAAQIAAVYDRLVDTARQGQSFAGVLAAEARRAQQGDIESILETLIPQAGGAYFWRSDLPVEELHEFATLLDALLEVGALTRPDVEAFLVRRAQVCRRREVAPDGGGMPAVGVLDEQLDQLFAERPLDEQEQLISVLADLALFSYEAYELALDRLLALRRDEPPPELWSVGEPRETHLGPPERHCGVRVLAVELCDSGVVVHLHRAINPAGAHGEHEPLADEVAAAAPSWPLLAPLRLHDDVGTAYRGGVCGADYVDAQALNEGSGHESVNDVPFAPAMPGHAARLWLACDDGSVRIDLR